MPRCLYGPQLKREIVAYTAARQSQKAKLREIATELGVSYRVLVAWMRRAKLQQEAGKIPFERTRPEDTPPIQSTAPAAEIAPAEDNDSSSLSELWLVLRVERMKVENRETLLHWLNEMPTEEPSAAPHPSTEHDSR